MKPSGTSDWVLAFAERMEDKLAANRHKGDRAGWLASSPEALLARVIEELGEVAAAMGTQASPSAVWAEAADVANMVAMLADAYEQRLVLALAEHDSKSA